MTFAPPHTCNTYKAFVTGWSWSADVAQALEKLSFKLETKHVLGILNMRTTYVVQLLVSTCSATSKSLSPLFKALRSEQVLTKIAELDSCIVNGVESFCEAWTSALDSLNSQGDFDIQTILTSHDIKAMTSKAKTLCGTSSVSGSTDAGGSGDVHASTLEKVFPVEKLISFTACDAVCPADVNMFLMHHIQQVLLVTARSVSGSTKTKLITVHGRMVPWYIATQV